MGAPPVLGFLKEGMYHERVPLQMFKRTGSLHPLPLFVCALPIFVTFPPDAVVHPGKPVSGQTRQQLHVGAGGTERRLRADVLSTQGLCCWNELAFFKKKHSSFLIFSDRTDRRMFAIVHFFFAKMWTVLASEIPKGVKNHISPILVCYLLSPHPK